MSDTDIEIGRIKMEEAQRAHDREATLFRAHFEAASKAAEVAVKTSVVVNGGAAIAVLTFIGGMVGKDIVGVKQVADVSSSLMWFASGVAAGVTALAFIYLMNYSAASTVRWRKPIYEPPFVETTPRSKAMHAIYAMAHAVAVFVSLISIILFVLGVVNVRKSIGQMAAAAVTTTPSVIQPKMP